jgi:peptidyl-tRNA hydrolase
VLEKFRKEEVEYLPSIINRAADAATDLILSGMQQAMAKYHVKI